MLSPALEVPSRIHARQRRGKTSLRPFFFAARARLKSSAKDKKPVHYSSLILFLGANFTQVYATEYDSGVVPAENPESIAAADKSQKRETPAPEEWTAQSRR
jgi:hypothetical protein